MIKRLKLQGKILLAILTTMTLILGAIIAYVSTRAGDVVLRDAQQIVTASARAEAGAIESRVEEIQIAARTMAKVLAGMDRAAPGARNSALRMLQAVLETTPGALTTWVVFEPDAFDGKDGEFVSREGYKEKGRFMATFLKEGSAAKRNYDITEAMLESDAEGAWYRIPLRSGEEAVMEPYLYSYTGSKEDEKLITSLCVPIRVDGRVAGVAGIDIDLSEIQALVQNLRVMGTGTGTLFSNSGIFVGSPSPELVGKSLAEVGKGKIQNLDTILKNIREGRNFTLFDYSLALKDETFKVHVPLSLGESKTPWSLSVLVPMGTIKAESRALTRNIALSALAGLLFMGVVVVFLVRRIVHPIRETSAVLERFGDLDFTYDPSRAWLMDYRDEIGDMTRAMGRMQEAVTRMVRTLERESSQFTSSAESLAALSQESVASMEEVKASVDHVMGLSESNSAALQETNAGIEEVSSGASSAAHAASDGAEASGRTTALSEQATDQVNGLVQAIGDIGRKTQDSVQRMHKVADSVDSISGFVATIRGIADQTNLLALNAAIEAARAGEAGRGFAVVAEEVRKLAEESAGAAKEVEQLIGSLKAETQGSLDVTSQAEKVMEATVRRAQETQGRLTEALSQIAKVDEAMQNIAATSEEQAAAAGEMASGIDQATKSTVQVVETLSSIQHSTDETARASEQVAQESQRLAEGALRLKDELARFRVGGDETPKALRG